MAEFYEFRGSDLLGLEHTGSQLILRIDACKHVWPEGLGVGIGTSWSQMIEITVDNASIEGEFAGLPRAIYLGSLKAKSLCAREEDVVGNEIPASLSGATDVEILIAAEGDDPSRYSEMIIRGASAAITNRSEPRFQESL